VTGSTRCFKLARIARDVEDAPVASAGMTWDDANGRYAATAVLRPAMSCVTRRSSEERTQFLDCGGWSGHFNDAVDDPALVIKHRA
jgi:hypothetical protein